MTEEKPRMYFCSDNLDDWINAPGRRLIVYEGTITSAVYREIKGEDRAINEGKFKDVFRWFLDIESEDLGSREMQFVDAYSLTQLMAEFDLDDTKKIAQLPGKEILIYGLVDRRRKEKELLVAISRKDY